MPRHCGLLEQPTFIYYPPGATLFRQERFVHQCSLAVASNSSRLTTASRPRLATVAKLNTALSPLTIARIRLNFGISVQCALRKYKQTYKPTNQQTNKPTNQQTNKPTNKQTNKQTNEHTNKQINNQTNRQTNKQTIKQTDKQTNKQAIKQTNKETNKYYKQGGTLPTRMHIRTCART